MTNYIAEFSIEINNVSLEAWLAAGYDLDTVLTNHELARFLLTLEDV